MHRGLRTAARRELRLVVQAAVSQPIQNAKVAPADLLPQRDVLLRPARPPERHPRGRRYARWTHQPRRRNPFLMSRIIALPWRMTRNGTSRTMTPSWTTGARAEEAPAMAMYSARKPMLISTALPIWRWCPLVAT